MVRPIKNPSPVLQANILSRYCFWWLSPLIEKCRRQQTLHLHDLYDIPSFLDSASLTDRLESNWFDELKHYPQNPSLLRATLRMMGWKLFLLGLLLIPLESLNILQPLLLAHFMKFFEPCSTMSSLQAVMTALGVILNIICTKLIFHQCAYRTVTRGTRIRLAYHGIIYRKVLRLSSQSMNQISTGEIMNLLANDAPKVELAHYFLNYLWMAPIQIITIIFLLWSYIRYVAFVTVGYTLCLLLIQPILSRVFLRLRAEILKVTDERVKIMAEIIKSMRIVKMYCWESAFEKIVRYIRKREMIKTTLYMLISSTEVMLSHSYISVASLLMFGTLWALNMRFDTRIFTIAFVLLTNTHTSSVTYFNFAMRDLLNFLAAKKRIEKFLLLAESERDNRLLSVSSLNVKETSPVEQYPTKRTPQLICHIKHAQWQKNDTFALKDILFDARAGDLVCVIGPVGSGKSSLLQTLTGEIGHFDGKVRLYGSFCYVPQESWIYSSSVKENILFGKDYNHQLFQRVVHATALDTDLLQLSDGVNTLVGDQGVMLSGGQKARVNLARALYRNADIYLLDDPLSAVDAKVSKHLFEKSIKQYLRDKVCILVTHQIQFLQCATKILVLDDGGVTQMGSYDELVSSSSSFAQLIENINQHEKNQRSDSYSNQQAMVESVYSDKDENEEEIDFAPKNIETKQEGTVNFSLYISYLRAGVGVFLGVTLIFVVYSATQVVGIYSNWWLAEWTNEESFRHQNEIKCMNTESIKFDRVRNMTEIQWNKHRNQRLYIFAELVAAFCFLIFLRLIVSRFICLNAGRVLHNKMFQRVIRSPILFFDTNPVGRILNRFTSDVATMDDMLPTTITDFLSCISYVLGIITLVGILNPWAFIPAFIVTIGMVVLRYLYAPCNRNLKRLAGITRSPVYSQLTSTIHGLKVIRSYHAEDIASKEFFHHLNNNTRVMHLTTVLNRWSAMRFDAISLVFIASAVVLAIVARITHPQFSTVDIALTLTYSINLMGLFQWCIRQSVEVEAHMTSVERISEYSTLEQEPPAQLPPPHQPPSNWPSEGCIVFSNVSMSHSYQPQSPLALQHVSLVIKPKEKIGIVGRTGAGKSSFIQCLFRMGSLVEGHIIIDDIDISTIGLDDLRCRISIIPQDPVLFTGTMRSNLDPFNHHSDTDIWNALEQVQLKHLVRDVMLDGLESVVTESGSNLSVGQKQLVCLARAILKKSRVLVIDEATANVDNATDELIQRAIRERFVDCTVLTVAHRLRTVIDSDRIMVLNEGKVVEFDRGEVLLSNDDSYFGLLVEQTGEGEAEYLRRLPCSRKLHRKGTKDTPVVEEERTVEMNETDPLLS